MVDGVNGLKSFGIRSCSKWCAKTTFLHCKWFYWCSAAGEWMESKTRFHLRSTVKRNITANSKWMDYSVSKLQVTLWNSSLIKAPRWSSAVSYRAAVLSSTEGMCVWCCSRRSIKPAAGEPCLSIKPPASSLGRTMLENSNVLWSCKEKERGAFQFLRAVRKEKSVSSTQKPRTRSASVLNVGIFAAGCSIPSASVYRL